MACLGCVQNSRRHVKVQEKTYLIWRVGLNGSTVNSNDTVASTVDVTEYAGDGLVSTDDTAKDFLVMNPIAINMLYSQAAPT